MINNLVIVRGGGDIASATIHRLSRCGFRVLVLEKEKPLAIRRNVSFCEAIYDGEITIEGIKAVFAKNESDIIDIINAKNVAIAVDTNGIYIKKLKPTVVIDAIIAKKNLGTNKDMAPLTIGLGPGFCAGEDVDVVIETQRGHDLGRLIYNGYAQENTGIPGNISGFSIERVIYSKDSGTIKNIKEIGDIVKKGDTIAIINDNKVYATIDGVLRGIIRNNSYINKNLKIADIDPRLTEIKNCFTLSDKARNISGSVLEAILAFKGEIN